MMKLPKEAAKLIAEKSKDVKINRNGVDSLAQVMYDCVKKDTYNIKSWKTAHELNPQTMTKSAVDWIFVADTLNFSFWSEDEKKKYMVKYKGKEYTGYWSWIAALNRAIDNGKDMTDPKVYTALSKKEFKEILKSDSEYDIPMFDKRYDVLMVAGKKLLEDLKKHHSTFCSDDLSDRPIKMQPSDSGNIVLMIKPEDSVEVNRTESRMGFLQILHAKYNGSFVNCIEQCDKSAQTLMKLVVTDFPSYKDEAIYEVEPGYCEQVAIYKRVQILIADIWACFEGKSYGEFHDIDSITMFADYRIPQALVQYNAMEYSDKLLEFLKKDELMKTGDKFEVEIRGCSIWAVELVCEETKRLLAMDPKTKDAMINAIIIDHYLWDYRRDNASKIDIPFHKIRCIYY